MKAREGRNSFSRKPPRNGSSRDTKDALRAFAVDSKGQWRRQSSLGSRLLCGSRRSSARLARRESPATFKETAVLATTQKSLTERSTEEDRSQLEVLQKAFKNADKDGNGEIDEFELTQLLQEETTGIDPVTLQNILKRNSAQKWLTEGDIGNVLGSFDQDKSGGISFNEFVSLARAGLLLDGKFSEYRQAFESVDTTGNGTIGAREIQHFFANLGQPLSESKLWKLFEKYDKDGSGQIEFPEFLELFRDELLDLKAILGYLEMHPREEAKRQGRLVEAELGGVTLIFSEAELDSILEEHSDRLVILEASLTWCRPCKGFEKTLKNFAAAYPGVVFLKFFGNSNENCKHLHEKRLQVTFTPTFAFFRKGAHLGSITGANKGRLYGKLQELLLPEENPLTRLNLFQQQGIAEGNAYKNTEIDCADFRLYLPLPSFLLDFEATIDRFVGH